MNILYLDIPIVNKSGGVIREMSNKENKKKGNKKNGGFKKYIGLILMMIIGGAVGYLAASYLGSMIEMGKTPKDVLLFVGGILICFTVACYLQIIIHEAGHLVFGLLSGYRFSSFRIGSFIWLKDGEKLTCKRLSIAGTGGQCLMIPPQMKDGKIPVVLYNLGGSIMNVIAGVLSLLIFLMCREVPFLSLLWLMMAGLGVAFALMNGIPMRMGMVDNDGYNALSLGKNEEAMRSFWIQMKANSEIAKGVRVKDMPKEWFAVPSCEGMKNSIVAVMGVFACNRLLDEHQFEEAAKLTKHLLSMDTAINGLHKGIMKSDLIYCELIGENRPEVIEELLDKEQEAFMKSMKSFISVLRTRYVYALLYEKDEKKAENWKKQFEKSAAKYPYACDVESERELMELAEESRTE